jgi:hypothetical protein
MKQFVRFGQRALGIPSAVAIEAVQAAIVACEVRCYKVTVPVVDPLATPMQ